MSIPENLKYSTDHEWAKLDGDIVTIGITDYAQGELGDIVFVEMPEVDDEFDAGETFGTIEAVKAVSDLIMPIGGTVVEINDGLEDDPETVNREPYEGGWMIKIKINDAGELDSLMDSSGYSDHIS